MFDRLRDQFPKVAFQNCAGGGGRLDWGMMRRFDNTELSDWMRPPRGLKILNGMTWVLPPEILLRTFGSEVGDLAGDGDVDTQLRAALIALPIFRGISPSLEELNPLLGSKIRHAITLYKSTFRPILTGCLVYHHTPLTPLLKASPWLVLEYTSADASRSLVTLFRTSNLGDSTYRFRPRGLDFSRNYRLSLGNSGQTVELSGDRLLQADIPVRLEGVGTSEVLLFDRK